MLTDLYNIDNYNALDVDWVILSIIILVAFFVGCQLIYMLIEEEKEKNKNGK